MLPPPLRLCLAQKQMLHDALVAWHNQQPHSPAASAPPLVPQQQEGQ